MISYDTIHWIENKVDMSLGGLGLNDVRLVTLVAVKVESKFGGGMMGVRVVSG
jgi:hypothetical protein